MNYLEIQKWIDEGHEPNVHEQLSTPNLRPRLFTMPSVNTIIADLRLKLKMKEFTDEQIANILEVVADRVVPAGTIGVVRGLEFNRIVRERIIQHFSDANHDVEFETICPGFKTLERPDWWLRHKESDAYVIGFNQVDLWSGGAQLNRAGRYILSEESYRLPPNVKILCVVCAHTRPRKGKTLQVFQMGIIHKRLCYTGNLAQCIQGHLNVMRCSSYNMLHSCNTEKIQKHN